jgi:hypothetical protein
MNMDNKRKVIHHELVFLLSNPEFLEEMVEYLTNLTPEQVESRIALMQGEDDAS